MHNVTPLIYTLEIERAIRRLDPFIRWKKDYSEVINSTNSTTSLCYIYRLSVAFLINKIQVK